jgi:branched-chain amino acid transport system substrate-binding protein
VNKIFTKLGLFLAIFALVFVTACGSNSTGGESSSGGESSNGSSSSGGSEGGSVIKIGTLLPMTAESAKMGNDMNNAIKMAAEEINENGGILGKQIEIINEDAACNPQVSVAGANKLVSQEVVAVVGGYCSGAALPASGVLNQAGIPWVLTAANSAKLPAQGYNNLFLLNSPATAQARTAADYIGNTLSGKRVAIINDNSAYSVDLAEKTRDNLKEMGVEIVAFDALNPKEKDFSSLVTTLKDQKPDVTYWTGYYAAGGLLLKQFRQVGVPGEFGVGDGSNDPTIIEIAGGDNAEGIFITTTPTPQFQPAAKDWIPKYKEKYGEEPGPYSAISYDGMRLMAEAIKNAGSTDFEAIIEALNQLDGFKTFSGEIGFDENGVVSKSNFMILVVKDGKFAIPE